MKFCFAFTFQILQVVFSTVFSIRNASMHFLWLPCMLLALLTCPSLCYHGTVSHTAVKSNCMCTEQATALHSLCAPDTNHHFEWGVKVLPCCLCMKSTRKIPDTLVFKKLMNLSIHVILGIHPFQYRDHWWLVPSSWVYTMCAESPPIPLLLCRSHSAQSHFFID